MAKETQHQKNMLFLYTCLFLIIRIRIGRTISPCAIFYFKQAMWPYDSWFLFCLIFKTFMRCVYGYTYIFTYIHNVYIHTHFFPLVYVPPGQSLVVYCNFYSCQCNTVPAISIQKNSCWMIK